jgi:hypothetical protein
MIKSFCISEGNNDLKRTLITAVQTFGSGKTHFGLNFIEQAKKCEGHISAKINPDFRLANLELFKAETIYVDLRSSPGRDSNQNSIFNIAVNHQNSIPDAVLRKFPGELKNLNSHISNLPP